MQLAQALIHADFGLPARGGGEGIGAGDVPKLVAGPPAMESDVGFFALHLLDAGQEFVEAEGIVRTAAEIECPARHGFDPVQAEQISPHGVVDIQHVADLIAIAVNRDWLAFMGTDEKMRHPTLVFAAILMRAVEAAHAQHSCLEPEYAGIVENILVGSAFGAAIGAVKRQRRVLSKTGRDASIARRVARAGTAKFAIRQQL